MNIFIERLKKNSEHGFTLLEVLISLVILSIGMLGIEGLMVVSINSNGYGARLSTATNLAKDKIEEMRNIPTKNLTTSPPVNMTDPDSNNPIVPSDNGNNKCDVKTPCGDVTANDGIWTYTLPATVDGITYNRIWTVQRNYPQQGMVTSESIVSWNDLNRSHQTKVKTILVGNVGG